MHIFDIKDYFTGVSHLEVVFLTARGGTLAVSMFDLAAREGGPSLSLPLLEASVQDANVAHSEESEHPCKTSN